MDMIKAVMGKTPYALNEHLSVHVNDERLDIFLSKMNEDSYDGLVSSWLLDWYDNHFEESLEEKQYVLTQTMLENDTKVLPILLCPDDFDFSCTCVVVEVIDNGNTVTWNRFGFDITPFSANETELPPYIGKEVKWFSDAAPLIFDRNEYISCIKSFGIDCLKQL